MKLHTAVNQYVAYRKSLGGCFLTNGKMLKAFARTMGQVNLSDVKPAAVRTFLTGTAPTITAYWHGKYQALRGFYRYALSRGYTETSPLPVVIPKRPQSFVPYICNVKELHALLHWCPNVEIIIFLK